MKGIPDKVRTVLDVDDLPDAPRTTRASEVDTFSASPKTMPKLVDVRPPLDNLYEAPEKVVAQFFEDTSAFPEMEQERAVDKSAFTALAKTFLHHFNELYDVGSNVQSTAGMVPTHASNLGYASKAISFISNFLGGASLILYAKDSALSMNEVYQRYSQSLVPRQELLEELTAKFAHEVSPTYSEKKADLAHEIYHPEDSFLSVGGILRDAFAFAETKEQRRLSRAARLAFANLFGLGGGAMALAGAAGAGIGALPGAIVSGVGGAVGLSVAIGRFTNYVSKKLNGTKGVDREAASQLIWGLALRSQINGAAGSALRQEIEARKSGPAFEALKLADRWAEKSDARSEQTRQVENHALTYLQNMNILELAMAQDAHLHLSSDYFGESIIRDLGSSPES